jgi:hypothetical protein
MQRQRAGRFEKQGMFGTFWDHVKHIETIRNLS